ncbi:MAG: methylenetetrahydrofolate--tRNA-(uracil(54)-C(5))-methyltransferase (FADH(2)-oxidizing) TrmFO [Clostridia bacterium]|nr:methylenetetrahydrofolate--tRNA-(uracil(54)-C(5))-methyltransferase (FADH(2)-oxidizing) TrmFO [Clostridia bacterium]
MKVNIIGGGLAGSECAYFLAENGIEVNLYEMKPNSHSPAHKKDTLAEIVCSNSLKNEDITTSSGLLKAEMERFGSLILKIAKECRVPAGGALAVNRDQFSERVDSVIRNHKHINVIAKEIKDIKELPQDEICVIATGPLTSSSLLSSIKSMLGDDSLYFFDASAPIVLASSLDFTKCFKQDRYSDIGEGDYLNAVITKEEYLNFYNELINAETVELKDFETSDVFEGCMPVEVMAKRGEDALRYGPLKPVGLNINPLGIKPYAVVQLRKENIEEESYNLVGFQTNLKFGEQKRVLSLIPALKDAEYLKYGVMHKNSFINSPKHLDDNFCLKSNPNIYFAGQLSGVEGYVESTASGLVVAISILMRYNNKRLLLNNKTMLGALTAYISNPANANNFQPMNSNYGIMAGIDGKYKDKKVKRMAIYERAMAEIDKIMEELR